MGRSRWERKTKPKPKLNDRVHKKALIKTLAARNRPPAEKREIWESIKRDVPEVVEIFKAFPGTVVMCHSVNGQMIGEDFSQ